VRTVVKLFRASSADKAHEALHQHIEVSINQFMKHITSAMAKAALSSSSPSAAHALVSETLKAMPIILPHVGVTLVQQWAVNLVHAAGSALAAPTSIAGLSESQCDCLVRLSIESFSQPLTTVTCRAHLNYICFSGSGARLAASASPFQRTLPPCRHDVDGDIHCPQDNRSGTRRTKNVACLSVNERRRSVGRLGA
jgi:hypothetical protein